MKLKQGMFPIIIIGLLWCTLILGNLLTPQKEISSTERRKLRLFPTLTADSVLSGRFMSDYEEYALDQFILRDSFRTLKAQAVFKVFRQKDNNGIYLSEGSIGKIDDRINEQSAEYMLKKLNRIYETFIRDTECRVFLSVIPDKGFYTAAQNGYPAMDYERLFGLMRGKMDYATYIDITETLSESAYYKTDTHWRQEKLDGTVKKLANNLEILQYLPERYREVTALRDFKGVYFSQAALPLPGEKLNYLTNADLSELTVTAPDSGNTNGVYDKEKLTGKDPYEFFLSGAAPVLYIDNPNAKTDRELILFRDSYASSLAPLLALGYARVTLFDTRYISGDLVGRYVNFHAQDVLFLYSTLIVNNSFSLK